MSAPVLSAPRTVTLRKNAREEVRVSVDAFKGMRLLNVRVWFAGEDGEMRPGKQGLAVWLEMAAELARAIREVCDGR
jgi:hypothetical protein